MPGSETPVLGSLFSKDASLTALTHLTVLETERSSLWRCSVGEGVLRNLTKFTGNTCARVSFLIKLQASGLQLYLKRDSGTGVFL